jgi:hypothetical protein
MTWRTSKCVALSVTPCLSRHLNLDCCYSSHSLLRMSHKSQNPSTCLLRRRAHRLKNAGMSVLPYSWPIYSPTHTRDTPPKTIIQEMIRRTLLQKYLAQFKSRSLSPCPLQVTGNRPPQIPGWKSFPTLRLGSLDYPSQIISLTLPIYFVFLDHYGLR